MKCFNKFVPSLLLLFATVIFGQGPRSNSKAVLAPGEPPLTEEMVSKLETVYEFILDIKFGSSQRERFRQGIVAYWVKGNQDGIKNSLTNLEYYGHQDELESLRNSSQAVIVESLRRDIGDSNDPVSAVLIEAFDEAHADRRDETRVKGFRDLVGTWKRVDYLLAPRNPSGTSAVGVGYTDSGALEIGADGQFTLIKVHNHCSGSCCRQDASTESGTISIKGTNLILQVKNGSSQVEDNCQPRLNQHVAIKLHTETLPWSIRPNREKDNVPTLCMNTGPDTAACYEKQ